MFGLTPYHGKNRGLRRGHNNIFEEIDTMFENFFSNSFAPMTNSKFNAMSVDIKENESEYVIKADLPGVDKEEINIELKNNYLTIAVERDEETTEERENYIRKERHFGSMSRCFYVDNIKEDEIDADFKNGTLSIKLPKKKPSNVETTKIDIK